MLLSHEALFIFAYVLLDLRSCEGRYYIGSSVEEDGVLVAMLCHCYCQTKHLHKTKNSTIALLRTVMDGDTAVLACILA
jgi:hypothetical protein